MTTKRKDSCWNNTVAGRCKCKKKVQLNGKMYVVKHLCIIQTFVALIYFTLNPSE